MCEITPRIRLYIRPCFWYRELLFFLNHSVCNYYEVFWDSYCVRCVVPNHFYSILTLLLTRKRVFQFSCIHTNCALFVRLVLSLCGLVSFPFLAAYLFGTYVSLMNRRNESFLILHYFWINLCICEAINVQKLLRFINGNKILFWKVI